MTAPMMGVPEFTRCGTESWASGASTTVVADDMSLATPWSKYFFTKDPQIPVVGLHGSLWNMFQLPVEFLQLKAFIEYSQLAKVYCGVHECVVGSGGHGMLEVDTVDEACPQCPVLVQPYQHVFRRTTKKPIKVQTTF